MTTTSSPTFDDFLHTAPPGAKYIYHIGFLMQDRWSWHSLAKAWVYNAKHYAAQKVYDAYKQGRVELVQQKLAGVYVYLAIKRRSRPNPRARFVDADYSGRKFARSVSGQGPSLPPLNGWRVGRVGAD